MNIKKQMMLIKKLVPSGSLVVYLGCAMIAVGFTFFLQDYTKQLLRARLNERLIAIVSTASLQFSGDEISKIDKLGLSAVGTEVYRKNVLKLQAIRSANKNIRYAYIIAKTADPKTVRYVVDADAMVITPTIDFNGDNVIDENDVSKPGDEYDATDVPEMQGRAFIKPTVDEELSVDTWGTFLSAYAPIFDAEGVVVGSLTIDVEVSDFQALVNTTFVPFLLFIVALLLLISFLTVFIVRIWKSRVQMMAELDRQKDELIGIVSHQLAKPVTAIKWTLESMLDGDTGNLNKEQKESAETMQTMAVNLADLVSMILDVSRIQLGRVKLDPQPLDLNTFFKEIIDVIEPTVKQKKINFIKNISPAVLPTVLLDRRYTRMTVENLLTNAVKYTPEGGTVTLDVSVKDGFFSCSVKDTGCGIPKADQGKIFGKMFRASNVRNTVEGNGFGLYVAKGAVEGQGGQMSFESEEGKGTRFWFKMPARLPETK